MAKSYVTKFTEYVESQRKQLYNKLKQKDLIVEPNETLNSLVSQIDLLSDKYKPHKYERDPNLPDLDEMFDNDPLRAINGGQYKGCYYALMLLDINGNVGLSYKSSSSSTTMRYYAEKIIFGDGVEYEKSTTSELIHLVGENGIYTTTNGDKYAVVKFYKTEPVLAGNYMATEPFFEIIDDFFVGRRMANSSYVNMTGYLINTPRAVAKYFRYVGSNVSEENIYNTSYWMLSDLGYCRNVLIEGNNRFSGNSSIYSCDSFIYSGTVFGSSVSSTSCTIAIGSTSGSAGSYCDSIVLPNTKVDCSATIGYTVVKKLFIPDSVFTSVTISFGQEIETLHIGANIKSSIGSSYGPLYSLRNVTVSPNAFNLNTSAITVDFSFSPLLTRESVLNMFNNFADRTGMTANILKLPAGVKSMMTDEEKLILTNKNWTLS